MRGVLVVVSLFVMACAPPRAPELGAVDALSGGLTRTFSLPDHPGRDFILHLPPAYTPTGNAVSVVFAFHGGGGRKEGINRTTCAGGDEASANCLFALADREGFAVVAPDGTDNPGFGGRSWSTGGGQGSGFRCVGGQSCVDGVDDVAYVDALLAEVRRAVNVDAARLFATGISNGGSMSHRLACDRSDVFAAIAAVGGANQADAAPGCVPTQPFPVMQLHGTEDPCWGFDGSIENPVCGDVEADGPFVGVEATMTAWRARNGCTDVAVTQLPDDVADGTSTLREDGVGCAADTTLLRILGGGHTWPRGWQYFSERQIGRTAQDFDGNEVIWAFFQSHPRAP